MEGIVPSKVQWRLAKANNTPSMMRQVTTKELESIRKYVNAPGLLLNYIDNEAYITLYEKQHQLNNKGYWKLQFFTSLCKWFEKKWQHEVEKTHLG